MKSILDRFGYSWTSEYGEVAYLGDKIHFGTGSLYIIVALTKTKVSLSVNNKTIEYALINTGLQLPVRHDWRLVK